MASKRGDRSIHPHRPVHIGTHGYKGVATDADVDPARVTAPIPVGVVDDTPDELQTQGGTPVAIGGSAAAQVMLNSSSYPGVAASPDIALIFTDPPTGGETVVTISAQDGDHVLTLPFDCSVADLQALLDAEFGVGVAAAALISGAEWPAVGAYEVTIPAGHGLLPLLMSSDSGAALTGGTDVAITVSGVGGSRRGGQEQPPLPVGLGGIVIYTDTGLPDGNWLWTLLRHTTSGFPADDWEVVNSD